MLYLGIDGGGTKTTGVLTDEGGNLFKKIKKGAGNIAVLDRGAIAQFMRSIVSDLINSTDIKEVGWATFAFAGAGRPEEREMVEELIRAIGIQNFTVMTDGEILHYSIFREKPGILISSGTGSICLVKTSDSEYHQIGGWGYLLGDEGSGFHIGKQAIGAILDEAELGNKPSNLSQEILSFYGLQQPENLISTVYSSVNPSNLIASCAKLVCELAQAGEPRATAIVEEAAAALVHLALKALKKFPNEFSDNIPLALAGGILTEVSIVNHKFRERAKESRLKFEYLHSEMEPAAAAVLHSFQKSNKKVPNTLLDKLKNVHF